MSSPQLAALASSFSADVALGLTQAEKLLLPPSATDFPRFASPSISNAVHTDCTHTITQTQMFARCLDCLWGPNTCFCFDCCCAGDHAGHTIVIQQGTDGICDCGNDDAMLPPGFCPKHQSVGPDPDLSLLDEVPRLRFVPVFSTVVNFAMSHFPDSYSLRSLQWLLQFAKWGAAYRRLVVNSLCDMPIITLLEASLASAPAVIPFLTKFTLALLTDRKLKQVLTDFFFVMFNRFTAGVLSGVADQVLANYRRYFSWTVQVLSQGSIPGLRGWLSSFVSNIIRLSPRVIADNSDLLFSVFFESVYPFLTLFARPGTARDIVYRDRDGFAEFGRRFDWDSSFLELIGHLSKGIQYGFKLVNADGDKVEKKIEVYERFPNGGKLDEVLAILLQLKNHCIEWNKSHPVANPNVPSGEWTLMLALSDLFFRLIMTAMRFLKIPIGLLAQRLEPAGIFKLVERSIMALAVLEYFPTPAFSESARVAIELATKLRGPTSQFTLFPDLFSHCTCYLAMEDNPVGFVALAIEVFGVKTWLESGGKAVELEVEPWLSVCLLCRFFVILLSDFLQPEGWDISDLIRPSVLHLLRSGPVTTQVAAAKYHGDIESVRIVLAALHEFGEPYICNGAQSYKLKSEHGNSITPFWIYFGIPDFLQFVLQASEQKSPDLLQIPRVDEVNGNLTGRFVTTEPFLHFLITSIRIFDGEPTQASPAVYFSIMALIQMVGEMTRILETPSQIESLVSANIFESLVKVTSIREPVISLMAHAKAAAPSVSGHLDALYSSLQVPSPHSLRKVDRAQILARFAAAREQFQRSQAPEDLAPKETQELCVACREPIDVGSQIWIL
jgi:hypothetical protein